MPPAPPPHADDPDRSRQALYPPPPDGKAQAAKGGLKSALVLALFAFGGVLLGMLLGRMALALGDRLPPVSPAWLLLSAVLTLWPHIVLHEAGHALAGISRGMRPVAFGVGPLRWDRGVSGWRFRRARNIRGISGFAALLPQGERGISRGDQALYLFGGPLANLLTAALALSLLPLAGSSETANGLLIGTASSALLIGLVNLVPFHSHGWRSDGRGLVDLLLRSPAAEQHQRIQRSLALHMAGVRPRDWPDALVPQPMAPPASPMLALNGDLLRLSWAMDRGDDDAATAATRRLVQGYHSAPDAFRPHLAISIAGFAVRRLHDPALASAWRPLCEGGLTSLGLYRSWLDAELAVLSGAPDAGDRIAATRGRLHEAPDPLSATLLGEYLDDLDERIAARDADDVNRH